MIAGATCFSGIGAPEAAMPGIRWLWHSEIERQPAAVLARHNPASANLGDVTADDFMQRASALGRLDLTLARAAMAARIAPSITGANVKPARSVRRVKGRAA